MKKILFAAVILLFGYNQTQAQVTFKPGIRAGANFSHFTKGDNFNDYNSNYYGDNNTVEFKSKTDFYVGVYGALRLTKYYTLQPEITYSRQGSKYENSFRRSVYNSVTDDYTFVTTKTSGQFDFTYLSVAVANKFTFNDRFNIHVGPTIDVIVEKDGDGVSRSSYGDVTDIDLAFFAGLGVNITKNLGIEARVKKGIVPAIDTDYNDHTNVNFSVGATYTFDIK